MPGLPCYPGSTHPTHIHQKQIVAKRVFLPLLAGDLTLLPFGNGEVGSQRQRDESGTPTTSFVHQDHVIRFQQWISPKRI